MSGRNHASYLKVGLTVVAAAVAVVAALVYFGGFRDRRAESYCETYYESSVSGLSVGSTVNFRGVKVGEVRRITFVGSEYETCNDVDRAKVLVVMALGHELMRLRDGEDHDGHVRRLVERGLRATVTASGVTGLSRIELDFAPADAPTYLVTWKPRHTMIPPGTSLLDNFSDSATRVMNHLNRIDFATLCSNLFETVSQAMGIVSNVNQLALNANGMLTGERDGIADIVANLRQATATADRAVSNATDVAANLNAILASRRGDIEALIENMRRVSDSASGVVNDNRGSLGEAVDELRSAAVSIREFADEVKGDPSLLLRPNEPEPLAETASALPPPLAETTAPLAKKSATAVRPATVVVAVEEPEPEKEKEKNKKAASPFADPEPIVEARPEPKPVAEVKPAVETAPAPAVRPAPVAEVRPAPVAEVRPAPVEPPVPQFNAAPAPKPEAKPAPAPVQATVKPEVKPAEEVRPSLKQVIAPAPKPEPIPLSPALPPVEKPAPASKEIVPAATAPVPPAATAPVPPTLEPMTEPLEIETVEPEEETSAEPPAPVTDAEPPAPVTDAEPPEPVATAEPPVPVVVAPVTAVEEAAAMIEQPESDERTKPAVEAPKPAPKKPVLEQSLLDDLSIVRPCRGSEMLWL